MKNSYAIIVGLCLLVVSLTYDSTARGGFRGGGGFHGGGSEFRGGGNFDHGYHGWGLGGYTTFLPAEYSTIIVDGNPYYYGDGYYFSPYSSGYIIVPEPIATVVTAPVAQTQATNIQPQSLNSEGNGTTAQSKTESPDTTTINIPNSNGGFTPVALVKHKNGYTGLQGEFYPSHPSINQLKALYGN
jgi:hypothetical protein